MDRKSQILQAAAELLQSRSFSAFSYHDLSQRLGITKASIHHHYATKEALGRALTDRSYAYYKDVLEEISARHADDAWKQFEAYVALMSQIMQSGNKICTPGILQAEHNIISKGMRAGISRQCQFMHRWMASVLRVGRKEGVMAFPGKPEDQATLVLAAVQGALQNARAEGTQKFSAVVRQLRKGIERGRR